MNTKLNTPTPRTNAAWEASFSPEKPGFNMRDLARTLERELTAEREKVRVLREALVGIDEEWAANHDSPFAAGNKMQARAEKALAAIETK